MTTTIIDLTDEQLKRLADYTACHGVSRAEAIRRAVDQLIFQEGSGIRNAFGAWKEFGIDSTGLVARLRDEWPD